MSRHSPRGRCPWHHYERVLVIISRTWRPQPYIMPLVTTTLPGKEPLILPSAHKDSYSQSFMDYLHISQIRSYITSLIENISESSSAIIQQILLKQNQVKQIINKESKQEN